MKQTRVKFSVDGEDYYLSSCGVRLTGKYKEISGCLGDKPTMYVEVQIRNFFGIWRSYWINEYYFEFDTIEYFNCKEA